MAEPSLRPGTPVIFDIGLHHGDDTDFYLKKGFDVVAVEADPRHVEKARVRFARAIEEGRLAIVSAAIGPESGTIDFYVNLEKDDWSSTDPVYGTRSGTKYEKITVPAVTFESVYNHFAGRVYYVKCDIEGGDIHVLTGLMRCGPRPKYFSVEAHKADYLAYMRVLGYTQFKLVNQNLNYLQKCPDPSLEGAYVPDHTFGGNSSGPFGEEAPGKWLNFEAVAELFLSLKRGLVNHPTVIRGWFDFHGKLE
jgi:FkbM family methyltransferase